MKLADVHLAVNGHIIGPFVVVLPQDVRGASILPDEGDELRVFITPRDCDRQTTARTKLSRT